MGDGSTDNYAALSNAAASVSSIHGSTLYFPSGTYYVAKYHDSSNSFSDITYSNCNGLTIMGDGIGRSIIEVNGKFTRSPSYSSPACSFSNAQVSLTYSVIPFLFRNCNYFSVSGLEVYGEADKTLRSSPSVCPAGIGIAVFNSSNYVFNNVYLHHFVEDGLYLGGGTAVYSNGDSTVIADRNASVLNSRFSYNGRNDLSVIQLNGGYFYNDIFEKGGNTGGSYGGDSPQAGVDVEPDYGQGSTPGVFVDVLTGNLLFDSDTFQYNNVSQIDLSAPLTPSPVGEVPSIENVTISSSQILAQGSLKSVVANIRNFLLKDSNINGPAMVITSSTYANYPNFANLTGNTIYGNFDFYSQSNTYHSLYLTGNGASFVNNFLYITPSNPGGSCNGCGVNAATINAAYSSGNTFQANGLNPGSMYYAVNYGTTKVRNDFFPDSSLARPLLNYGVTSGSVYYSAN